MQPSLTPQPKLFRLPNPPSSLTVLHGTERGSKVRQRYRHREPLCVNPTRDMDVS